MKNNALTQLTWVAAAAAVGFGCSAIFSGLLHWQRRAFLVPYLLSVGLLGFAYLRANRLDAMRLARHRWRQGLAGAVVLAAFGIGTVLAQPASAIAQGWRLAFDLGWSGILYGVADSVLLSVIPMLAGWKLARELGWAEGKRGAVLGRAVGIAASLAVTAAYHLGFPEYQGPQVVGAMFGNGILTLGYALTGSPLAPVLSHVVMHVAALLRGPATMSQLPPHL